MTRPASRPQLCLETTLAAAMAAPEPLAALVTAASAVTVILKDPGAAPDAARARTTVHLLQSRGTAVLVENDAALALTLAADGVHLTAGDDLEARYSECRRRLGRERIVGVDAGTSRHDAMTLAELGADYVAFRCGGNQGPAERDVAAQGELVAWWAEVFEVPVVAMGIDTAADGAALAAAGADFIAVSLPRAATAAEALALVNAVEAAVSACCSNAEGAPA